MYNFRWQLPGKLAGMARPMGGPDDNPTEDIEFLRNEGVSAIVSLTEFPLPEAVLRAAGIEAVHEPTLDGYPPGREQIERIISFIEAQNAAGRAVAVHCAAGHGRTGTVLACCLVKTGLSAAEAIANVRDLDPFAIETPAQETAILAYERRIRP